MHISHQQFVELLAETSGIEPEKVEQQLTQLVTEIRQSLEENEAYEIEGFGIFSSIGPHVMFIPSKELETEINYKYVGMEPIKLDEPIAQNEREETDPFEEVIETSDQNTSRNPFVGLIDDSLADLEPEPPTDSEPPADSETPPDAEQPSQPAPDEWGVEAHKEEKSADRLFASLMGEEYQDSSETDDQIEAPSNLEEKTESSFLDDLMGEAEESQQNLSTTSPESIPIEDEKESEETQETTSEPEEERTLLDSGPALESPDDFDDPFLDLEKQEDDNEIDDDFLKNALENDEEEILPVITNISSTGGAKDQPEKDTPKKEETSPKKGKKKKAKPTEASQPASAWLYILLIIVILGGGGTAAWYLGYLNLNTPFSNSSSKETTSPSVASSTPVQPTPTPSSPESITNPELQTEHPEETEQEQSAETEIQEPTTISSSTENNPEKYGLTGDLSSEGNDGYTIVLYSLSNRSNAIREQQKLANDGYRAMVVPYQSERFGQLWRVSVGQFASLYDAAVAAEEILDILPENYFIKKIN